MAKDMTDCSITNRPIGGMKQKLCQARNYVPSYMKKAVKVNLIEMKI